MTCTRDEIVGASCRDREYKFLIIDKDLSFGYCLNAETLPSP